MKLIVGLGNPGEKYKNNRHNIGYLVCNELTKKRLPSGTIVKKTNVFMNESGEFVNKLVEQYHINSSDLWVIHDDLDIPLGSYKIQKGRGPKLHNGVNSIERSLGTDDFFRVRVGIENRNAKVQMSNKITGEEYVLQDFTKEEKEILDSAIQKLLIDLIGLLSK